MFKSKIILMVFSALLVFNSVSYAETTTNDIDIKKELMKKFGVPEMSGDTYKRLGIEYGVLQNTMTICGPCASVIIDINSRYFANCGKSLPAMELLETYDYEKMFNIAESIYKSKDNIIMEQRLERYTQEMKSLTCPASLIIK